MSEPALEPRATLASSAAFAFVILLALAAIPSPVLATSRSTAQLSPHPGMQLGVPLSGLPLQVPPNPNYDEQLGFSFAQAQTALAYNVTAQAQTDADGYGPAYILNGLTNTGYWYQVGVSYHWPSQGGGFDPAFAFSYEVFGPDGSAVYPTSTGAGLTDFSRPVNSGDIMLLSLTFFGSAVQMSAKDWNTGATAQESYASTGSSTFVGSVSSASNGRGFFTGIMTEWYHVSPYMGNIGKVVYTSTTNTVSSAWMWVDEFVPGSNSPPLFDSQSPGPVTFANPEQVYPYSADGATVYGSAHQFITGLLSTASSKVFLTPAVRSANTPSFIATYKLANLAQTTAVPASAPTMIEADPGTTITISVNSSASSGGVSWVFASPQTTTVGVAAGANATYSYYGLVLETVSFRASSPGSLTAPSAANLVYEGAPSVASAISSPVQLVQRLTTTPAQISVVVGSTAKVNGTTSAIVGHEQRWSATPLGWNVTGPGAIPNPIELYLQDLVTLSSSVSGGGSPTTVPDFLSTSTGGSLAAPLTGGSATAWVDDGSSYQFTHVLNGTAGERWLVSAGPGSITGPVSLSAVYAHQYLVTTAVNNAAGGTITPQTGFFDAGGNLNVSSSASQGWQFENWAGSGTGVYQGTRPSFSVVVTSPIVENATFYVQVGIAADAGTDVAYSYLASCGPGLCANATGSVASGTTKMVYVPPNANVTLKATPSLFVYSFGSWQGTPPANAASGLTLRGTNSSITFSASAPVTVSAKSSYNYPVVFAGEAAVVLIVIAAAFWVRARRRRARLDGAWPAQQNWQA